MDTPNTSKQISKGTSPSDNRVKALLMEYELSYVNANHIEGVVWNTAAILVTGSITGLALLGNSLPDNPSNYDYLIRAGIGVLSVLFVYWWRKMASVWYFVQYLVYYRIVEIEEELDLYCESYISYLDKFMRGEKYPNRPRVKTMISSMKSLYKPLIVPQIVNTIGWVLTVIWFAFFLVQIAAILNWL